MRSVVVIILHALVAQVSAEELATNDNVFDQKFMEKFADKFVDKLNEKLIQLTGRADGTPMEPTDLDETTLGKAHSGSTLRQPAATNVYQVNKPMTSRGAMPLLSRPSPVMVEFLLPATRDRRSTMVYGGDIGGPYAPLSAPPMGRPEFGSDDRGGSHASSNVASAGTPRARGGQRDLHAADYSQQDLSKLSPSQLAFLKRKGGAGAAALNAPPAPAPAFVEDEGLARQKMYNW